VTGEERGERAANLLHHYAGENNEGELDDDTIVAFIVDALHYAEKWYGGADYALTAVIEELEGVLV
jgi:hypothetical protein